MFILRLKVFVEYNINTKKEFRQHSSFTNTAFYESLLLESLFTHSKESLPLECIFKNYLIIIIFLNEYLCLLFSITLNTH